MLIDKPKSEVWVPNQSQFLVSQSGMSLSIGSGCLILRTHGRVIRDAYLESDLKMSGIDYKTAALYVRIGMTDTEIRSLGVTRVVPVRRYSRGQASGMISAEALHGDADKACDKWIFPDRDLTLPEKRRLIAGLLEVACWENSVNQFGGRYFHQLTGLTGAFPNMSASRLVIRVQLIIKICFIFKAH